jgi:cytidylate kinase
MQTRIVAISHAWGAGGEGIGRGVAERLGFRYVNEEVITLAADKHGVDAETVADAERRKGLLHRLVESLDGIPVLGRIGEGVLIADTHALARRKDMRALIVEALHDIAEIGNAVIVAHAASIALAGRSDLLRVLITASDRTRIKRLADGTGGDLGAAAKFMADSDAARADYFRRFYHLKRELPTHYDVILNTDALDFDEAIDIVVAAAQRRSGDVALPDDGPVASPPAPRRRRANRPRPKTKSRARAASRRR